MPKAKWGTGSEALTAGDIDGVETSGFAPYTGDVPRSGLYRFVIVNMKQTESNAGNPMVQIFAKLDGTWKPAHAKYEGAPMFDRVPVMKSTAFRVRALTDALGVTSKQFLTQTVTDDDKKILRIGDLEVEGQELLVYCNVEYVPAGEYSEKIQPKGTGWLPVEENDSIDIDGDTDPEDDTADGDDEPPF